MVKTLPVSLGDAPMTHATLLWSIWQTLLKPFAWVFTRLGHRRFVEWITAMA